MGGPLRPNLPPPPSSLMAVETLERWKKDSKKKPLRGQTKKINEFFFAFFINILFKPIFRFSGSGGRPLIGVMSPKNLIFFYALPFLVKD